MSSMKESLSLTEDFLCSLIELTAPDYEMWRPYFEFDILRLAEELTGDYGLQDQRAELKLRDIVARFLDPSVPMWVKETILKRFLGLTRTNQDVLFRRFFMNILNWASMYPEEHGLELARITAQSELIGSVFQGVE